MVQFEELREPLRVLLAALDRVQLADHPVDQGLTTARQVEEHGRDARTQCRLLGGDPHRLPVYDVEGQRHLTDLVAGVELDGVPDLADDLVHPAVTNAAHVLQPLHGIGQVVVGHGEGALAQSAQRVVERAGQHHGQRHGDDQGQQHQDRLDHGLPDDVRAGLVGLLEQSVLQLDLSPAHQVVHGADRRGGVLCGDQRALPDRAGDVGGHPVRQADRVAGNGAVDQGALHRVGGQREGDQGLLLTGQRCHEGGELLRVELAGRQRGEGDGLFLRDGSLGAGEGGDRAAAVRQALVAGQLGQAVTVRDQVGKDDPVAEHRLGDRHLPAVQHLLTGAVQGGQVVVDGGQPVPQGGRHVADPAPLGAVLVHPLLRLADPQVVRVGRLLWSGEVGGRGHPFGLEVLGESADVDGEGRQ
ncbi:hypothetical protein ONO86_04216 [Micromonospora noduli]|nr:hypothetical protein ONO86_04216 [Micromonospora noduli]